MKNINQEEWKQLVLNDPDAIIIDVRRPDEWVQGIIENAWMINVLDRRDFEIQGQTLNKEKNYYIYCRSGKRSASACLILKNIGVNNTHNLLGGILNWEGTIILPQNIELS